MKAIRTTGQSGKEWERKRETESYKGTIRVARFVGSDVTAPWCERRQWSSLADWFMRTLCLQWLIKLQPPTFWPSLGAAIALTVGRTTKTVCACVCVCVRTRACVLSVSNVCEYLMSVSFYSSSMNVIPGELCNCRWSPRHTRPVHSANRQWHESELYSSRVISVKLFVNVNYFLYHCLHFLSAWNLIRDSDSKVKVNGRDIKHPSLCLLKVEERVLCDGHTQVSSG